MRWKRAEILAGVGLLCVGCLNAGSERTTEPGEINHAEGSVYMNNQRLSNAPAGARLNAGATLKTADGRVEVLLSPGAFLRVGKNTELTRVATNTKEIRLDLRRGEVLLEIVQLEANLCISMDENLVSPVSPGLYELDSANRELMVYAGEAQVQSRGQSVRLHKRQAVLGNLQVESFDTGQGDPLYAWSAAASEREAEASYGAARSMDSAAGGWYWNAAMSCWSFLPRAGVVSGSFGWAFSAPRDLSRAMLLNGPIFHYPAAVDPHNLPRELSRVDADGSVDIAHAPRLHGPDHPYSGDQGPGFPASPVFIPH